MYINLLHQPLLNFVYLFFLSFPLNIFVNFVFIALFPTWHLALVSFSSLCFSQLVLFLIGKYNFWFPLFTRSIYFTLFLLDCFDFAYGNICICIYSVTLCIVVINLCFYVGLLQFCGVFLFSSFFFLLPFFYPSSFFMILSFNFFKPVMFFLPLFLCLPFLLCFSPCS